LVQEFVRHRRRFDAFARRSAIRHFSPRRSGSGKLEFTRGTAGETGTAGTKIRQLSAPLSERARAFASTRRRRVHGTAPW
jgi:hypothetical protein